MPSRDFRRFMLCGLLCAWLGGQATTGYLFGCHGAGCEQGAASEQDTASEQGTDRPDVVVADFEAETYGKWTATGTAFGGGPAPGTLPNQMHVSGYRGERLVNSYVGGDGSTGTLTSPPFELQRLYVNFLIGGGKYPGETCINLLLAGDVVRTATGPNDAPGGTEALEWDSWDVRDLVGKTVQLEIVDRRQGGWGHINVDQIEQSDRARRAAPAVRELVLDKRYLHFPVKNGARPVRLKLTAGNDPPVVVDEFTIELAPEQPDYWVFLDVGRWQGQTAHLHAARMPSDSQGWQDIVVADETPGGAMVYQEKYRPQFHFTTRRGWNNDPNGLVYYQGTWHMYYQHNPYGRNWGNMHWGHAASKDLVHWRELPVALFPFQFDDWAFSGGAVVDHQNTAGFQQGDDPVIVASYTSTGRGESLAYSQDGGLTFTDYSGNPIVQHQGRDPKIIWYEPGRHWVMAVYDERPADNGEAPVQCIAFYVSPDLKNWERTSHLDGYYECPEIYELAVDGNPERKKWVVYAADGAYAIGNFDGRQFVPEHEGKHRFNWGDCFYASQTFSNVPEEDGRRIQIAWGRTGHESMPFNQQMNFPVVLTLRTTQDGVRQFAEPVREIARLYDDRWEHRNLTLQDSTQPEANPLSPVRGELLHVRAELEPGEADTLQWTIRGLDLTYDVKNQTLRCRNLAAPLPLQDGRIRLELLVDRLSLEIFGNDGQVYMPVAANLVDGPDELVLRAEGGSAIARSILIHTLRSAWSVDEQ